MKRFFLPLLCAVHTAFAVDKTPSEYYTVEDIATPPGLSSEVGGLAFMPDGKLVACFHRGEVYTFNPETKEWKLFAQGLHDPLGVLAPKNDEVIVMQRPELTRLRDTNGDGVADSYETICDAFGMTGNYHEFAFGPLAAPDGGWFVALNVASNGSGVRHEVRGEYRERGRDGRMYSVVPWRGWVVKISPEGKLTPWASGFRSPNGLGYDAEGRLFVPDNQGDWIGTSPLYQVEKGKFYGHPSSLTWKAGETRAPLDIPVAELDKTRTRGAVLFPHNIVANSPTQPFTDTTEGKFGPFAGQLMIGEMNRARILRVVMEEVGGQLQGMATPLLDDHGLSKGDNRFAFAPDGSLWVGQTDHGWAGDKGIQRITWTGKVPLDVKEMHLTKTGFDLTFTRPLETASTSSPESFQAQRYYYEYHAAYGSKQFELEKIMPKAVTVSEDRMKVTLEFEPLTAWRIYQFDLKALKAEDGAPMANPLVVYTLNHLLETTPPPPPPGPGALPNGKDKPDEKKPEGKDKAKPAGKETKRDETKPAEKEAPATAKPDETKPETKPATEKKAPATPKPDDKKSADPKPTPAKPDEKSTEPKKADDKKPADKPATKKPSTPSPAATPTPTPSAVKKKAVAPTGAKR
jgi:glucose/arabinose dehydrogenase